MTPRRSARLRNEEAPAPVEVQPPATATQVTSRKRKAPVTDAASAPSTNKAAKSAPIKDKPKESPAQPEPDAGSDALSALPQELLDMVVAKIPDVSTIGKLGRTCKKYYSLMMPHLHKRIAVAAMFHAHIPKLIRSLEPYLTIAQKKQLRKEGKYKGQQERYSTRLDKHAKPLCADHVRQIVVGVAGPGRRHEYIVHRYIEEAFKNLKNLEIIESYVLTEPIAQSIAAMGNLQALSLHANSFEADAKVPLAKIKNLKHLSVYDSGWCSGIVGEGNVIRDILLNSTTTLRSLAVCNYSYSSNFLKDWEKHMSSKKPAGNQKHDLVALKSLDLKGLSIDAEFIKSLQRAIDFMGLRELSIGDLKQGRRQLFEHLTSLTTPLQASSQGISLRSLSLSLSTNDSLGHPSEEKVAEFEAQCQFVSSFNTLTSLQLKDYNQYRESITTNPGLDNRLLQAILNHRNLKELKISYQGILSGRKIPYLSAATMATIVDGLHQLEDLDFAPEESEIEDIGRALARGRNLKSVNCFPHDSWTRWPRPTEPGFSILEGIVKGYLSCDVPNDGEKFVWEDHYELRRVSVTYRTWDVASVFGKAQKGMKKAGKIKDDGNAKREAMYRDITGTFPQRVHVGYDPNFPWVEKVSRDIA